ncbi:MAG: hypothetical protein Q9222_005808 [Ikaeria aurantiellina]
MEAPNVNPPGTNRLGILLDDPPDGRESYIPGDLLKGEIILYQPYHAAGVEVSITFSGTSRVQFKEKKGRRFFPSLAHNDDLVFRQQTNISRTKNIDPMIWKFQLRIPSNVQDFPKSKSSKFSNNERYVSNAGYALPPSFTIQSKNDTDTKAEITYRLEAILKKPHFSHSYPGPPFCKMDVPVSASHDADGHRPRTLATIHSISPATLTAPVHDDDNHQSESSWAAENPSLTIFFSAPDIIVAGKAPVLELWVSHNLIQIAAEQLSPLTIKTLSVNITSQTNMRASRLGREYHTSFDEQHISSTLDGTDFPEEQRMCGLTECNPRKWDIAALMSDLSALTLDAPAVKTSNLAHSYTLRMQAQFILGEEAIDFDTTKALKVLPRCNGEGPQGLRNHHATPNEEQSEGNAGDAPPSYSQHQDHVLLPSASETRSQLPSYDTLNHT